MCRLLSFLQFVVDWSWCVKKVVRNRSSEPVFLRLYGVGIQPYMCFIKLMVISSQELTILRETLVTNSVRKLDYLFVNARFSDLYVSTIVGPLVEWWYSFKLVSPCVVHVVLPLDRRSSLMLTRSILSLVFPCTLRVSIYCLNTKSRFRHELSSKQGCSRSFRTPPSICECWLDWCSWLCPAREK